MSSLAQTQFLLPLTSCLITYILLQHGKSIWMPVCRMSASDCFCTFSFEQYNLGRCFLTSCTLSPSFFFAQVGSMYKSPVYVLPSWDGLLWELNPLVTCRTSLACVSEHILPIFFIMKRGNRFWRIDLWNSERIRANHF